MSWIDDATEAVAERAGVDPGELSLTGAAAREILEVARIASHASGERINAPLLCFVMGVAVGKGASLDALVAAVRDAWG